MVSRESSAFDHTYDLLDRLGITDLVLPVLKARIQKIDAEELSTMHSTTSAAIPNSRSASRLRHTGEHGIDRSSRQACRGEGTPEAAEIQSRHFQETTPVIRRSAA